MGQIVLISPEKISGKMAGVGIRYWNFAIELSKWADVILAAPNSDFPRAESFSIASYNHRAMAALIAKADVVVVHGHISNLYFDSVRAVPTVVDLYDPFMIENLNYFHTLGRKVYNYDYKTLMRQLALGDFFLCSTEHQRAFYLGMLCAMGRLDPDDYCLDPNLSKLIGRVPFGVPQNEPKRSGKALRGVLDGIGAEDKVIFFGGIYDWYDPETLLKALEIMLPQRGDLRVIFVANPNPELTPQLKYGRAMEFCGKRGWLNKFTFFIDWFDYSARQDYYLDCDLSVVTHRPGLETDLSMRTRILDYLWAGLPVVCTEGGEMSYLLERWGAGVAIKPGDFSGLAAVLSRLLDDERLRRAMAQEGMSKVRHEFSWAKVVEPLVDFCLAPRISKPCDLNAFFCSFNRHAAATHFSGLAERVLRSASKSGAGRLLKGLAGRLYHNFSSNI